MAEFTWKLHGADGDDVGETESFGSKEEAESWMGAEWSRLLDEGAEHVTLMEGDRRHYRMGLREG